jgi:cytochrome P450
MNRVLSLPAAVVNWADPRLFGDGPPHAQWAAQRAVAPIWFTPRTGPRGASFWSVCDEAGVRELLTRPEDFAPERPPVPAWLTTAATRLLAEVDPAELAGPLRSRLRPLLDGLSCDFARDLAGLLPQEALRRTFGLSALDGASLAMWGASLLLADDPDAASEYRLPEPQGAAGSLRALFIREVRRHRRAPGDDLLTVLGSRPGLSPGEVARHGAAMLGPVYGTARMAQTAAVAQLVEQPGLLKLLRAEPELLDGAVAEILRLHPPVSCVRRVALRATRLAGERIAADQRVRGWLPPARRDPAVWADPEDFDPRRAPVPLAGGPDEELAGLLAQVTVRGLLAELSAVVDEVVPAGPVRWLRSATYAGHTHAEVVLRPRPAVR